MNLCTCLVYATHRRCQFIWIGAESHHSESGPNRGDRTSFNIASYALLTIMVAQVVGLEPGEFVHTLGDAHLYYNHLEQAREQLARTPGPLPTMVLNPDVTDLFAFRYEDFRLDGYDPAPSIRAPIAV